MDKLTSLMAFCAVVEEGSFAAAGRRLQVSGPMVSKYIQRLERDVSARLLIRSTRSVTLTEHGQSYYQQVQPLVEGLMEADRLLSEQVSEPRGRLSIALPVNFGERYFPNLLAEFRQRYPKVMLDIQLLDRSVDMYTEPFDVAICVGDIKGANLIVRPLLKLATSVCAAPVYLQAQEPLCLPSDLATHRCLLSVSPDRWPFMLNGQQQWISVKADVCCNNVNMLIDLAVAGAGVVYLPTYLVQEAINRGDLQQSLVSYTLSSLQVSAVYHERQLLPLRLRCFIDFMMMYFHNKVK